MDLDSGLSHRPPAPGKNNLLPEPSENNGFGRSNHEEAKKMMKITPSGMNFPKISDPGPAQLSPFSVFPTSSKISEAKTNPNVYLRTPEVVSYMTPPNVLNKGVSDLYSNPEENKKSSQVVPSQAPKSSIAAPPLLKNRPNKSSGNHFSLKPHENQPANVNLNQDIAEKTPKSPFTQNHPPKPIIQDSFIKVPNFNGIPASIPQKTAENPLKLEENLKNIENPFDTYKTPPAKPAEFLPTEENIKKLNPTSIQIANHLIQSQNLLNSQIIPKNELPTNIRKMPNSSQKTNQFLNLLLEFIDTEKVLNNFSQFSDLCLKLSQKFSQTSEKLERIKNVFCFHCKEKKDLTVLRCKCVLCKECIKKVLLQEINLKASKNFAWNKKKKCLACQTEFSREEEQNLIKINSFDETQLERLLKHRSLERNINLKCSVCKKDKKRYHLDSCLHVCLECQIFSLRNDEETCPVCGFYWPREELLTEKLECGGCVRNSNQSNLTFYHNYGISLHSEACFLCLNCAYNSTLTSKCEGCKISLKQSEKIELNYLIFIICTNCKQETFRGYASRSYSSNGELSVLCKNCAD